MYYFCGDLKICYNPPKRRLRLHKECPSVLGLIGWPNPSQLKILRHSYPPVYGGNWNQLQKVYPVGFILIIVGRYKHWVEDGRIWKISESVWDIDSVDKRHMQGHAMNTLPHRWTVPAFGIAFCCLHHGRESIIGLLGEQLEWFSSSKELLCPDGRAD